MSVASKRKLESMAQDMRTKEFKMKNKQLITIMAMLLIAMLPAAICVYADTLTQAAEKNDVAEIQRLIAEEADVNASDYKKGWTALMYAAEKNAVHAAKLLIEAGADMNTKDKYGDTALMLAAEKKRGGRGETAHRSGRRHEREK